MTSEYVEGIGCRAKAASRMMSTLSSVEKDRCLLAMAESLRGKADLILKKNTLDVDKARQKGAPCSLIDRLTLTEGRVEDMARSLEELVTLKDPVGQVLGGWKGAQDIEITKVRVPIGVIGIIYEARPNVTADAAGICFKTGNAVILRGSSDALESNRAMVAVLRQAIAKAGGPEDGVQLMDDVSRAAAAELMHLNSYVDLLIPRGGPGLIQTVVREATVPVIETGVGNCHIYVDESADLTMALNILRNAKTQRTGVCNAAESLLVHQGAAEAFLRLAGPALKEAGVELRACSRSLKYLPDALGATEEDFYREFLDKILSVKIIDSLEEAIAHINQYGTGHSEAIVTKDYEAARKFTAGVDAAAVYVNASTRFTDGGQFGLGAEMGISTQKLHARGPMGLEEMTSVKYIIYGEGQIRK